MSLSSWLKSTCPLKLPFSFNFPLHSFIPWGIWHSLHGKNAIWAVCGFLHVPSREESPALLVGFWSQTWSAAAGLCYRPVHGTDCTSSLSLRAAFPHKITAKLSGLPGPMQQCAAGASPRGCVKCLLTRQAELAVIFTAMAVIIGCMANLTDTSHPKYFSWSP